MVSNNEHAIRLGASVADVAGIKLRTQMLVLNPDQIDPDPDQPRHKFDKPGLEQLAASLLAHGQLQPVLVRKDPGKGGRYVLIAGERRWRAAKLARMEEIRVIVYLQGNVRSIQLVENLLREDLRPTEKAKAYRAILDTEKCSIRELARRLSLDHSGIAKSLDLLDLPEKVQEMIDAGQIPPTTAYAIAKKPKSEQVKLAKAAASGKINGVELRRKPEPPPAPAPAPAPALAARVSPPKPVLTLGITPEPTPWVHSDGHVEVAVTGYKNQKEVVAALERALQFAKSSKGLAGGLG